MAMAIDACLVGNFCVEPGIFVSIHVLLCRTGHFCVEPAFLCRTSIITPPCHNFNGSLLKPPFKFGHRWIITCHKKVWLWLIIRVRFLIYAGKRTTGMCWLLIILVCIFLLSVKDSLAAIYGRIKSSHSASVNSRRNIYISFHVSVHDHVSVVRRGMLSLVWSCNTLFI